jgi:hypothetical protein
MTPVFWHRATAVILIAVGLACTSSIGQTESAPGSAQASGSDQPPLIDHVTPRRDFTGPAPTRFEWTAVKDADEYAIGLWNEVDTMVWRQSGLRQPSVEFPKDNPLEPGTYYWSVTGLREGQPIAHSGLSAFVVMPQ